MAPKHKALIASSFAAAAFLSSALRADVVINEICYSNTTVWDGTRNGSGVKSRDRDWVELYNNGAEAVDVGGFVIGKKSTYEKTMEAKHCVLPAPGSRTVFFMRQNDNPLILFFKLLQDFHCCIRGAIVGNKNLYFF